MNNKDFDKPVASVKEGGKMLRISDDVLNELIAVYGFLVQKTLPLNGGDVEINKEYIQVLSALEELKILRKQNDHLIAYTDKLIEPLDYLPKDIENIRKANYRLHEVEAQNKLLIEDGDNLADFLNREVGVYENGNSFKCVFCGETNGVHAPDCPFGKMMNKHEELKAQIETKV